jgi:hypothetical protein
VQKPFRIETEAAHCILCYYVLVTVFLGMGIQKVFRFRGNADVLATIVFEADSLRVLRLLGKAPVLESSLFY